MIKLKNLLPEKFADDFGKNRWVELPQQKTAEFADNIVDLISAAYAAKGGNFEIQSANDLKNSDVKYWIATDIDDDPEADAAIGGKKTHAGTKITMMGQDGSSPAKKSAILKTIELMKKNGFYAELDPDLAQKFGLNHEKDEDVIRKVLKKDITMNPDGSYERMVAGTHKHTKVLVGIPKA